MAGMNTARAATPWRIGPSYVLALLLTCATSACGGAKADVAKEAASLEWALQPSPPVEGPTSLRLVMNRPDGTPLKGATVRVEANMNHAGMVPEFADGTEVSDGTYEAEFEFTMGGDWYLAIEAIDADGKRFEWIEDVAGVQSR